MLGLHNVPNGLCIMKYLLLSTFTRQLIILILLIALLWQSMPLEGPDGLVNFKFDYYPGAMMHGYYPKTGEYFDIEVCGHLDRTLFEINEARAESVTNILYPAWIDNTIQEAPWLSKIIPAKWISQRFAYHFVVRVQPEDWKRLEDAKQKGYRLYPYYVPKRFIGTGRRLDP